MYNLIQSANNSTLRQAAWRYGILLRPNEGGLRAMYMPNQSACHSVACCAVSAGHSVERNANMAPGACLVFPRRTIRDGQGAHLPACANALPAAICRSSWAGPGGSKCSLRTECTEAIDSDERASVQCRSELRVCQPCRRATTQPILTCIQMRAARPRSQGLSGPSSTSLRRGESRGKTCTKPG